MRQDSAQRWTPLAGLVAVAIVVVAFSIGGDTPDSHDPAGKVTAFYAAHSSKQQAAAIILIFSAPFLVWFTSHLRHVLRSAGGTGRLANSAFAGGILAAGGFLLAAGVHYAVADAADSAKSLGAVQTLSILDADLFFPFAGGLAIMILSAGIAAVRHGGLPSWLAWAGVVIGVAFFTPAGFVAFLLSGVWIIVASLVLFSAQGSTPTVEAAT
jgi:hypothetical protein